MTISFDNTTVTDHRYTNTIAEAIAGVLQVSGLHLSEWEGLAAEPPPSGWSWSGGDVITASGRYDIFLTNEDWLLDVGIPSGCQVIFYDNAFTEGFGVKIVGSDLQFIHNDSVVYIITGVLSGGEYLRIAHFTITNYKFDVLQRAVCVWRGDRFIGSHFIESSERASVVSLVSDGAYIFTAPRTDDIYYPSRAVTVDSSENIQAALNRIFQTETKLPIHLYSRYNGVIRFYTRHDRPATEDITAYRDNSERWAIIRDWTKLKSYVRAVSAYPEADYLDGNIADKVGPAYLLTQNPNITTITGAMVEAERVQDSTEKSFRALQIAGYMIPVLEPGEYYMVGSDKWHLEGQDVRIGAKGKISATINMVSTL